MIHIILAVLPAVVILSTSVAVGLVLAAVGFVTASKFPRGD